MQESLAGYEISAMIVSASCQDVGGANAAFHDESWACPVDDPMAPAGVMASNKEVATSPMDSAARPSKNCVVTSLLANCLHYLGAKETEQIIGQDGNKPAGVLRCSRAKVQEMRNYGL